MKPDLRNAGLIATMLFLAALCHQPLGASETSSEFTLGSLGYSLATNLFAHTNVSLSSKAEFLFSTSDYSTTNFVRNSSFWLGLPPQLTATVIGAGGGTSKASRGYLAGDGSVNQYIGGTAISPVHVINCRHAPFVAGNELMFVDQNGSVVFRTVLGNAEPYGDINVCLLRN